MAEITKILVPTDFSECANAAASYAIQLAQLANAPIEFLHLQWTPVDWVKLPLEKEKQYPETLKEIGHARNELNNWVKKAVKKGVKASPSLIFDSDKMRILSHVNDGHSLIVMGSNGATGFKEKLIGSNAQHVLRNATVPVLIIKQAIMEPVKNILFVSDFKDVSEDSFNSISDFADLTEAHIELLFVNTEGGFEASDETNKNMNRLMSFCHREDSCTRNIINANTIEEGINSFLGSQNINLIAICTHGKGSLTQVLLPSITEEITNHSNKPVLSIKLS